MSDRIRVNQEALQPLFDAIGRKAVEMVPGRWYQMVLGYFIEQGERLPSQQFLVQMAGEDDYQDMMEEAWNNFDLVDGIADLGDLFCQVHDLCAAAGDDWSEMTFVLNGNLEFHVDFRYDPIAKCDRLFLLDWQSRYLE